MGHDIVWQGTTERLPRAVGRDLAEVKRQTLVRAGRVKGIEFVAELALDAAGNLSEREGLYLAQSPLGEARYKLIADTAAGAMAAEVAGIRGLFR